VAEVTPSPDHDRPGKRRGYAAAKIPLYLPPPFSFTLETGDFAA
jgi:hypothetical protein